MAKAAHSTDVAYAQRQCASGRTGILLQLLQHNPHQHSAGRKVSGGLASYPAKLQASSLTKSQIKSLQEGLNNLLADGKLSGFKKLVVDGICGNDTPQLGVKKSKARLALC